MKENIGVSKEKNSLNSKFDLFKNDSFKVNNIYLGDSLKLMKKIKDNFIDHTITSPPYNMNLRVNGIKYCSRQIVKEFSTKYNTYSDNLSMDEYFNFTKNTINELLRITKGLVFYNIQFLTGNKRALFKIIGEFNEYIKEIIIWDKITSQPAMATNTLNSQFELIIILTKDKKDSMRRRFDNSNFDRGTMSNLWKINRSRSNNSKLNSATFPKELINRIIKNFSENGDLIFDPFVGTGTTVLCAKKNNRNYLGFEIDKIQFNFLKEILKKGNEL